MNLRDKVSIAVGKVYKDANDGTDYTSGAVEEIMKAVKECGYIHIPTGKNVTVTTGDNEGGKLMTEQEWREKFADQQ